MTGYGRGESADKTRGIAVEISGVNRKQLEIFVSLPREWQSAERRIAEALRARVQRGKVSVSVSVRALGPCAEAAWDAAAVAAKLAELGALAQANGIPFQPDARLLLDIATLTAHTEETPADEALWVLLKPAVEAAIESFLRMRAAEGAALARDLADRIDMLDSYLGEIKAFAPAVVERYRETLFTRLRSAGLELDLNDERVLKEISLFADRADIAEEITRLDSHFSQFRAALSAEEPAGRKMDFLCQEINREFNTIGSKASSIDITKRVLSAKNELERLREQVQNIE